MIQYIKKYKKKKYKLETSHRVKIGLFYTSSFIRNIENILFR